MTDTLNPTDAAASAIDRSAADVVADLTLEEKASLTSGASFWTTKPVERVGLPAIMLTDGPHGVRKQRASADHLGIGDSVPATCFPPAVALGSSFDPELLVRVGAALGEESQAERVGVLLGPGINIKRSPLCGRNFEYLSEDPIVSGVLGSALVRGLQSQGVGASLKHFAANNQEADRMRVSADIDERPLREIYLRGFQRVVAGRAAVDRHVLVQPPQRRLHVRGPVAAHEGAPRRVGLRRPRRLGLGRRERPRHRPRRGPRPRDAVERGPHRRPARRRGALGRARRAPARHGRPPQRRARAEGGARCEGGCRVRRRRPPRARARGRRRVDRAAEERRRRAAARRRGGMPSPSSASSPARRATRAPGRRRSTRPGSTTRSTRSARSPAPTCRSRPATTPTAPPPTSSRPRPWPSAAAAETVVLFLGVPGLAGVRGLRPRRHRAARRAAGAGRRGDRGEPAHRRRALERRRGAPVGPRRPRARDRRGLAARPGRRRRGRRRALRCGEPLGPPRRDDPGAPRRQPRLPRLPGRALARALRRGPVRGLPLVRRPRARGVLPVRARAVVHDVRVLGCRGVVGRVRPHRARHRDEHGRPRRRRGRAGLHVAARLGRRCAPRASSRASRRSRSRPASPARSTVHIRREDLAYWDTRVDRWVVEGGSYTVEVGASSRDIRATVRSTSRATRCACRSR